MQPRRRVVKLEKLVRPELGHLRDCDALAHQNSDVDAANVVALLEIGGVVDGT